MIKEAVENVDAAEINKFAALAHKWWDPESEFKPLHRINPLRLNWIQSLTPLKGLKVLDVGCGGGILSESMARAGASVTGIDMGEKAIQVAKLHLLESDVSVDYHQVPVERFADDHTSSFDVVTCMEMLEHVPDPASIINACANLVKPSGSVYFSTISRNPKAYLFAVLGAEYLLNLLPKGTHDYDKFIKPSELSRMARESQLASVEMKGLGYNPVLDHYHLTDDTSVNYMVQTIKQAS